MKDNTLESPIPDYELDESLRELTAPEYILPRARQWAETENGRDQFIIDAVTGVSHDYASIEEKTRKIASAFYKRGMRKYDTVIYMTYDMVNIHLFFIGVWRANGIVRASYPEEDADTLLDRVEESRVGWILCDESTAKMCLAVADQIYWGVEVIVVGEYEGCTSLASLFEDDGDEMPEPCITPSDIAMVLCTSGTTGRSKGAAHTHSTVVAMIEGIGKYWPFSDDKMNFIVSKGTHISGAIFPLSGLVAGKLFLVIARISKECVFRAVNDYKPGLIWGFPTFLLALVNDSEACNYDFSSLEIACSGGAPVTPAIIHTLMELPNVKCVINAYGLTEICPIASTINFEGGECPGYSDAPPFATGKVFPGVSVQIRDTNGDVLGPNQNGEICAKSMYLCNGYFKNEEATSGTIQDGWFKTGDMGYYDENGFLFLVDRMKEIFKYYNNHISPTELEDVIGQHPAVAESCVIGVIDPDGGDRIPRAFVKLKDGNTCQPSDISEFANAKLPDYKKLRGGVYILEELPKGKTGKVARQLVAQLEVIEE